MSPILQLPTQPQPTTFTGLGQTSAHSFLWAWAVAILATVARQAARLLNRLGQEELCALEVKKKKKSVLRLAPQDL